MKSFHMTALGSLLMFTSPCFAGLPFNISVPAGQTLPSIVYNSGGGVAYAYYQIQNGSSSIRAGNFVKWLPPNVTQVLSPGYCGETFTLQPFNTAGDHCTLKLAVHGNTAPNPAQPLNHQSLFVCLAGGKVCAGPAPEMALHVTAAANSPLAIANGHYESSTFPNNTFQLVGVSQDSGKTWRSRITSSSIGRGLPADLSLSTFDLGAFNLFYQPRCTGNNCISVGSYENDAGYFPFISQSQNLGLNWTSVLYSNPASGLPSDLVPTPLGGFINTYFDADCTGTLCVAAGSYATAGNLFNGIAFLSVSQDAGQVWSSPVNSSSVGTSLPSDLDVSGFSVYNSVSCHSGYCVAAGVYASTAVGTPVFPLITLGQSQGSQWTTTVSSATPNSFPADYSALSGAGFLFKVDCSGTNCVTVGGYETTALGNPGYHMILVSHNNGMTWSPAVDSSSIGTALPSDYITSGSNIYWSISCAGMNCVATGRYKSTTAGGAWIPLITSSQDGGYTWAVRVDATSLGHALPSDISSPAAFSQLLDSSCHGTTCVAVGHYQDTDGNRYPLLLNSVDGGVTWNTRISGADVGNLLPAMTLQNSGAFPFADNTLYGVSCTSTFCFAAGSYESLSGELSPLIIVSYNNGVTWQVVVNQSTSAALPTDSANGTYGSGAAFGFGIQGGGTSGGGTSFKAKSLTEKLYERSSRFGAKKVLLDRLNLSP